MIQQETFGFGSLPLWQRVLLFALPVLTLLAYFPAIRGDFIWDDDRHVSANPTLVNLRGLDLIWFHPSALPQYYPMTHTSFWVEYRLWGADPLGYHIDNVLLQIANALLLWRLLVRLQIPGAALAAAIFALHPIEVESVAWISERKNLLSTCFALLSILAYLRSNEREWPLGSFLLFTCAMLSKTVACSLPAVLLVIAWWKRGRVRPRDFARLVPFCVVGLGMAIITARMEVNHVGARGPDWDLSFTQRILIAGRAVWFYLAKLLWPVNLTFSYPRWNIDPHNLALFLFPAAFLGLILGAWLARQRIGRGPVAAISVFAGVLVPALGFFNTYPMRYSFVADHFQYAAGIAIITLASAAMVRVASERWLVLLFAVGLSILTWRQAHAYAGPEALWRDVIAKNDSSWLALDSLAYRLTYQPNTTPTQLEEAAQLYARVQQLRPQHPLLQQNWGDALFKLGQWSEALAHYEMALTAPGTDRRVVEDRMGIALGHLHQFNRAEEHFRLALAIDPADAAARCDLAEVLAAQGRTLEASGEYDVVLQAHPEMPAGWLGSAKVRLALNRPAEAADRLERYVQLAPEDADGHERLGQLDLQLGRPSAAVKQFAAAVALRPDSDVAKQELTQAIAAEGKAGQ